LTRLDSPRPIEHPLKLAWAFAQWRASEGSLDVALDVCETAIDSYIDGDPQDKLPLADLADLHGELLERVHKPEQALASWRFALAERTKALGEWAEPVGRSLHRITKALGDKGDYGEALVALERAGAIAQRVFGDQSREYAGTLWDRYVLTGRAGRKDEAFELCAEAIRVHEAAGLDHNERISRARVAYLEHAWEHDWQQDVAHHSRALLSQMNAYEPGNIAVLIGCGIMGAVANLRLRRPESAIACLDACLTAFEKSTPCNPGWIRPISALIMDVMRQPRPLPPQVLPVFRRAVEICGRACNHHDTAWAQMNEAVQGYTRRRETP